ncbi:hypothetical protein BLOT_015430 [Blomia tropicalis]|nr:hypothetical protein BLOT_015430 [Blomia tropicalis]
MILIQLEHCVLNDPIETTTITTTTRVSIKKNVSHVSKMSVKSCNTLMELFTIILSSSVHRTYTFTFIERMEMKCNGNESQSEFDHFIPLLKDSSTTPLSHVVMIN